MNRRIEVEFWYDDSLQELPDEPQMCPGDPGAELVTRVYDSPRGELKPVMLDQGTPVFPPGYLDKLKLALSDVADKTNPRVRFVGYTKNEGLDRRTALVYGDDIGLSAARARRTMEAVAQELQLTGKQTEFEGRGYLYSDDVVNAGFVQGDTSYVAVQVVYDEPAILDKYDGVEITPLTRDLKEAEPLATNLMRITVDGKPIDDKLRSSQDVQRCTDVAMQDAGIQFTYDSLADGKRLNVAANTETVQLYTINPAVVVAGPVRFRMYSNYGHYIDHAEVRIFDATAASPAEPLTVIPVGEDSYAEWRPDTQAFAGPVKELEYAFARVRRGRSFRRDGSAAAVDSRRCVRQGTLRECATETGYGRGRARRVGAGSTIAGSVVAGGAVEFRRKRARDAEHPGHRRHGAGARQRSAAESAGLGGGLAGTGRLERPLRRRGTDARGRAYGRSCGARRRRRRQFVSARPQDRTERLAVRGYGRRHVVAERQQQERQALCR